MKERIFGYDLIRAIAILLVMLGHVLGFVYNGTFSFFYSFLLGFFGVELFFVLSGVLIGKILIEVFSAEKYVVKLKNFILRRWLRTLPLYFVMLLIYWLGNLYLDPIKNADVSLWKYVVFLQNFFHVQPTFFGVSWSLSIEEWFYIIFPLVLLLIKNAQPQTSTKTLMMLGIIIFSMYFLIMRLVVFSEYQFSFYEGVRKVAFFRLDSIAFGILGAFLFEYYSQHMCVKKYILLFFGILILIINQYLIFRNNYSNLWYFNTFYYSFLGIGLVLLFPFFREIKIKNSSLKQAITYLSTISYSLYLVHWIIFKLLEMSYLSTIPGVLKFLLFFMLSFIVASCTYQFIEKPFLNYRKRFR